VRRELLDALLLFLTKETEGEELSIADWRLQEHVRRRGRTAGAGKGKETEGVGDSKQGKRGREEGGPGKQSKKTRKALATAAVALEDDPDAMDTTPIASTSTLPVGPTHALETRSSKTYTIPDFVDKTPAPKPAPREPLVAPARLSLLSVGINEVTRALETRIRWGRWELGGSSTAPPPNLPAAPAPSTTGRRRKHHTPGRPIEALNTLMPTSNKTLTRPSMQFITMPTPVGLVQPVESNPFFRLLAPPVRTQIAPVLSSKVWAMASDLLSDVMEADDPAGARLARKEAANVRHADILMGGGSWTAVKKTAQPTTATAPTTERVSNPVPIIDLVFVCKPDINPPSLVAHLPTMTAAANGVNEALSQSDSAATTGDAIDTWLDMATMKKTVFLIPLDLGAEKELAAALGLRRVATLGVSVRLLSLSTHTVLIPKCPFQSQSPDVEPLLALISKHFKPLLAPWLVPHLSDPSALPPPAHLIPTHVKHLRSSAPLDPRASNASKKADRKAKKQGTNEASEIYVAED
jgi:hypothetical protein